jgi:hypothetical protein
VNVDAKPKPEEIISSSGTQKKINNEAPKIKTIIEGSEGYYKLFLFMVSIPLTLICFFIFIINLIFPMFVSIPLGLSLGIYLTLMMIDKLKVMLK